MLEPLIIAVSGGSGSGKTTFCQRLHEKLGANHSVIIAQDSYYIDQSENFDRDGGRVNFDHPSALDFELLHEHLELLLRGAEISLPIYDFATHTRRSATLSIPSRQVIILDGTLVLSRDHLRPMFYKSIFIDTPEEIRFQRRLKRDIEQRGRTEQGVREQFFNQVRPMHQEFVAPSKKYADYIIDDLVSFDQILFTIISQVDDPALTSL